MRVLGNDGTVTVSPTRCIGVLVLAVALSACSSPEKPHANSGTTTSTSSPPPTGTTIAASGVRTVLSPVGLNIRAQPATTATILRTAAQGAVLTVLAQSDQGSGWFEVRGPTVTGWMSAAPNLSAPGIFASYSSTQHQLALLYPQGWTPSESPPASVVFRPASGADTVVVTTASTAGQLVRGRLGYHQTNDEQVVVCGVTADMVTFVAVGTTTTTTQPDGVVAERYLVQVHLTLDPQHALGIDANLADTTQLQNYRDLVNSVTFPFPECQPAGA